MATSILEYLQTDTLINQCFTKVDIVNSYRDLTLEQIKSVFNTVFNTQSETCECSDLSTCKAYITINEEGEVVCLPDDAELQRMVNTERGGVIINDYCPECANTYGLIALAIKDSIGKDFFNEGTTKRYLGFAVLKDDCAKDIPYTSMKATYCDTKTFVLDESGDYTLAAIDNTGIDLVEQMFASLKACNELKAEDIATMCNRSHDVINFSFEKLNKMFRGQKLTNRNTVSDYYFAKFKEWVATNAPWLNESAKGMEYLYKGILTNDILTYSQTILYYPNRVNEVNKITEQRKDIIKYCTRPMFVVFQELATDALRFINECVARFVNDGSLDAIKNAIGICKETIEYNGVGLEQSITDMINAVSELGISMDERTITFKCDGVLIKVKHILPQIANGIFTVPTMESAVTEAGREPLDKSDLYYRDENGKLVPVTDEMIYVSFKEDERQKGMYQMYVCALTKYGTSLLPVFDETGTTAKKMPKQYSDYSYTDRLGWYKQ